MFARISLIFALFLVAANAVAQQNDGSIERPAKSDHATYFLIDSSGSMQRKDAEAKVQEILNPIILDDESAQVSRTYFRAEGGSACWDPVVVGALVPAAEGTPTQIVGFGDRVFTPSGEALRAALLASIARGGTSDIFIISDEEPTPGCGIDICEVAKTYLPAPGINVQSIQVDDNAPRRRDIMGCIDAYQSKPLISRTSPQKPSSTVAKKGGLVSFLERWMWLLGFLIIYFLSFGYGWTNQSQAIKREAATEDIRALERASLVQGNNEAQDALADKLKEIRNARAAKEEKLAARSKRQEYFDNLKGILASRIPPWQITTSILVFGILFWIAATNVNTVFSTIDVEKMRSSAWSILDSDFATAFAVIWIVSLFYSGIQVQRRKEADAKYSLVSREAEWAEEIKKRRATDEANRKLSIQLSSRRSALAAIKFGTWENYLSKAELSNDENAFELKYRFQDVQSEAKRLAAGSPDEETLNYANEIDRLKLYMSVPELPNSRTLARRYDFEKFLRALLADTHVNTALSDNWRMLADAIAEKNLQSFSLSLTALELEIN